MNDIDDIIMGGMVFKAGGGPKKEDDGQGKDQGQEKEIYHWRPRQRICTTES